MATAQSNVLQTKFREEMTFGHLGHVKFMEIFTIISFLAQMADPMFAYNSSTLPGVPVRADVTTNTTSLEVEFTETVLGLYRIE